MTSTSTHACSSCTHLRQQSLKLIASAPRIHLAMLLTPMQSLYRCADRCGLKR
jgi:hypothetical protein